MKLSSQTLNVLKNYASINQGILFKKGNTISTMSAQKNILSEATIPDEIPQNFGIYDLNNFLSVVSLNKDPEIEFDDKNAIIKSLNGRSKIKYRFTDASMIVSPPEKKITLPSVDVAFTLTEEDFAWIQKTSAVLGSPHIAITSDGTEANMVAFDATNDSAHTTSITIDAPKDKSYKMIFKTENLKMIPGSYIVEISSKGIASFKNTKEDIQYWIATEATGA
jgi:hypothetical protein